MRFSQITSIPHVKDVYPIIDTLERPTAFGLLLVVFLSTELYHGSNWKTADKLGSINVSILLIEKFFTLRLSLDKEVYHCKTATQHTARLARQSLSALSKTKRVLISQNGLITTKASARTEKLGKEANIKTGTILAIVRS